MEPLTILLVDPDEASRTALANLLRRDGHLVTVAGSWDVARRLASEKAFEILISELSLPHRHERQIMRQLKDRCGTFGMLLTAFEKELACGWRQSGFSKFLFKPISYDRVRSLTAGVLAARSINTPERMLFERRDLCHS